ncbi:MAG TPA: hypothetical protein VGG10_23005 [Rhizomicrobium sp.]
MSYFEYEAIYFGIIVGLALANILTSLHKLIEAGKRVHWGWMAPASAAFAATLTINEFWSLWLSKGHDPLRTILAWYPLAMAFALLFLMCAASLPDDAAEGEVDLAHFYIENRRRFWGFSTALHALNLLTWMVAFVQAGFALTFIQSHSTQILANLGVGLFSLTLVFSRAKWWHTLGLLSLWLFTLAYFGPLRLN